MFALGFVIAKFHDLPCNPFLKMYEGIKNVTNLSSLFIYAVNRDDIRTCLKNSFKPTNQNHRRYMAEILSIRRKTLSNQSINKPNP